MHNQLVKKLVSSGIFRINVKHMILDTRLSHFSVCVMLKSWEGPRDDDSLERVTRSYHI